MQELQEREKQFLVLKENSKVDDIFRECIMPGYNVYKDIMDKLPSKCLLYLCPYVGTGDVYLAAMYMRAYAKKNQHKEFCAVVIGKANYKVASLFGFEYVISITQWEADCLTRLYMVMGAENVQIKIMHHHPPQMYCGILENLRNINELSFTDLYLANVFRLDLIKDKQLPTFNYSEDELKEIMKENELKKGKTVIISPYANTLPSLPQWVWENLADKIKKKGYCVCTNIGNPTEQAIKGTIPLRFEFSVSVPLLEMCGYFIGIRSGLCDIISSAKCKKIIIYQPYLFWGEGTNYDYFSLNKIGFCEDAIEVSYEGIEFLKLIDEILNNF